MKDLLPVPDQLSKQLAKCKSIRDADTYYKSRDKTPQVWVIITFFWYFASQNLLACFDRMAGINMRGVNSMHGFIYERVHHAVVGLYGWLMTASSLNQSITHYYLFLLFDYVAALCTILIPQHDIFDFTTMAHHVYWCKNRKLLQPRQSYHQCQRRNKKQNKNVHNHEII